MATGGRSDRPELLLEWLQLARCARHVAVGTWTMPPKLTGYRKPHGGPQVLMAFVQEIAPADPWAIEKVGVFDDLRRFYDLPVFGRFSRAFHREKKGLTQVGYHPPRLASRVL